MTESRSFKLFTTWLSEATCGHTNVRVYKENCADRKTYTAAFTNLRVDHFVGHAVVARAGGFDKVAKTIENSLPKNKRVRSGDVGEVLATEYLIEETRYQVPIKKLRWKDDREVAMRGNDVIGVNVGGKAPIVAKVESKSRGNASAATVAEAAKGLDAHGGRPNPSTLGFIAKRLLEQGRDAEAAVFEHMQTEGSLKENDIEHVVFVFSGNDPSAVLAKVPAPKVKGTSRTCAAVVVADHADFVRQFFEGHGPT
jgi:hypothetical protein